jgi:hypothetical protein
MSYDLVRQSISEYVKANFTGWPVTIDGFPYEPDANKAWVRFGVQPNVEVSEEVSGKTERMEGFITFAIFLPENKGMGEAYKIGDALKVLFFEHHIIVAARPTVMCRAAPLKYVGNDGSGWERWAVAVPYRAFAQVPP